LEISFNTYTKANDSVAVASTDSWTAYARNGVLELDLNGTTKELHVQAVLDSGWHTLLAESAAGVMNMSLDGRTLARVDSWNGNLTRVELGSGLEFINGSRVQGALQVNEVTADLQPLIEPQPILIDSTRSGYLIQPGLWNGAPTYGLENSRCDLRF